MPSGAETRDTSTMEPNAESDSTNQRAVATSLAGFGAGGQSKLTDAELDKEEDDGPTD